jgi:hypothetical protein
VERAHIPKRQLASSLSTPTSLVPFGKGDTSFLPKWQRP